MYRETSVATAITMECSLADSNLFAQLSVALGTSSEAQEQAFQHQSEELLTATPALQDQCHRDESALSVIERQFVPFFRDEGHSTGVLILGPNIPYHLKGSSLRPESGMLSDTFHGPIELKKCSLR